MKFSIKEFMKADISKFYILIAGTICLLVLGGYFSYAMFTVSKEQDNAVSIITGNLEYDLEVNGEETNTLTVPANSTNDFIVTLSNPNNREARFNFYYEDTLPDDVTVGYVPANGVNAVAEAKGINLSSDGSSGSSNTYRIQVKNDTDNEITVTLGAEVGLDYNDLTLPENTQTVDEIELSPVAKTVLSANAIQDDSEDMFNYVNDNALYASLNDDSKNSTSNSESTVSGLYAIEDDNGISYYFRGNVLNNNVQFGEYDNDYYIYQSGANYYQSEESCIEAGNSTCTRVKLASKGDKMYWKIVRINGDGSLRLIYNGISTTPNNSDLANSYAIGVTPYNLTSNDPKYTGYTYDNGTTSFIKKEVDTWYSNTLGSNTNYDSKVLSNIFCSDSSGYKLGTDYGLDDTDYNVFASFNRLRQDLSNYAKPNTPTLKCQETEETYGGSYNLKAALITIDELNIAGLGSGSTNYLSQDNTPLYYWTMTPAAFNNNNAFTWLDSLDNVNVTNNYAIRPVINLSLENAFASGSGTTDDPYIVS